MKCGPICDPVSVLATKKLIKQSSIAKQFIYDWRRERMSLLNILEKQKEEDMALVKQHDNSGLKSSTG